MGMGQGKGDGRGREGERGRGAVEEFDSTTSARDLNRHWGGED